MKTNSLLQAFELNEKEQIRVLNHAKLMRESGRSEMGDYGWEIWHINKVLTKDRDTPKRIPSLDKVIHMKTDSWRRATLKNCYKQYKDNPLQKGNIIPKVVSKGKEIKFSFALTGKDMNRRSSRRYHRGGRQRSLEDWLSHPSYSITQAEYDTIHMKAKSFLKENFNFNLDKAHRDLKSFNTYVDNRSLLKDSLKAANQENSILYYPPFGVEEGTPTFKDRQFILEKNSYNIWATCFMEKRLNVKEVSIGKRSFRFYNTSIGFGNNRGSDLQVCPTKDENGRLYIEIIL